MKSQRFDRRKMSSSYFKAEINEVNYMERTQRNHHWVGGPEGQKRLHNLRVGVAGLGGMGSNVAEILVRLGVGHIKIADPDTIEATNINRQVIANLNTVGTTKVAASAKELRAIAGDFELVCYDQGITADNAQEFVSDLDVIIDEIDVYPLQAHVHLHQAARELNLPLYSGYIIGLGTHIYKFHGNDYTFEDFVLNDKAMIAKPTAEFLVDRYFTPFPSYMSTKKQQQAYVDAMNTHGAPIFGATCYAAQSFVCIRMLADYLGLPTQFGTKATPIMPEFIKVDPLDLGIQICRLDSPQKSRKRSA
jgi:molybdopterin/thiamine biosynthesis adenylyltransferase